MLVFVVDSTDPHNIAVAVQEIKTLTGDERLKGVPILFIASKQDVPNAMSTDEVADALDIKSIPPSQHKVKVLGTQLCRDKVHSSILEVKKTILKMI